MLKPSIALLNFARCQAYTYNLTRLFKRDAVRVEADEAAWLAEDAAAVVGVDDLHDAFAGWAPDGPLLALADRPVITRSCERQNHGPISVNPSTPKRDQHQISPAAPQQILHHKVWRTWLFIAYPDERWLYYQFSLPQLYISLYKIGRMFFFFELGSEGVMFLAGSAKLQ